MGDLGRWTKSGQVSYCTHCEYETAGQIPVCPVCRCRMVLAAIRPDESAFRRRPVSSISGEVPRVLTGYLPLDTVLGGGFAAGSVLLLAGPAGVGKSTLMLQAGAALAFAGTPVLMVSAEEGENQFRDRCRRLFGTAAGGLDRLWFLETFDVRELIEEAHGAALVVVDSLQAIMVPGTEAPAGSLRQVVACTAALVGWARRTGVPVAILGRVTKDGTAAGPADVWHLVDVVCYLNTTFPEHVDAAEDGRVLHAHKNRYGPVPATQALRFTDAGLVEVEKP